MTAEPTGVVPPLPAIQSLRRARIAERVGRTEEAKQLFEEAANAHPAELLPILRLVRHYERFALDGGALGELRGRLVERLQSPTLELSASSIEYLILDEGLEEPGLRALEARFLGELEGKPAPPVATRVDRLDALERIYVRLDERGRQREIVGRLLEIESTPERRWRALNIDRYLERWSDALALVRQMLTEPDPSGALVDLRLELLARSGEIAELERRLDERPLEARPGEVERLTAIAWILEDSDRRSIAERVWRRILRLEPDHPTATRVLTHLHGGETGLPEPAARN